MQKDLHKASLASRFPSLPPLNSTEEGYHEEQEQEEEEETDNFSSNTIISRPPPSSCKAFGKQKDYSPVSAAGYFEEALEVAIKTTPTTESTFRVYYTPPSLSPAPTLSSAAISSSSASPSTSSIPAPATAPWLKTNMNPPSTTSTSSLLAGTGKQSQSRGVVFVFVHGAGYSGLSGACLAKELVRIGGGKVGVLSFDARGHGKTKFNSEDMSLESMTEDLVSILSKMFPIRTEAPALVLVGHSMGGAVVANACSRVQDQVTEVSGVTVIDVVEGAALEALVGMASLVTNQPKGFDSIEQAIEWHVRTKTLNNLESARISIPQLFVEVPLESTSNHHHLHKFVWRANLLATEPFWKGWFTGLSQTFLNCRTAKLLILAGADRLDKELMIGQMQGKYQLEVFPEVGHCIQEDAPEKTAEVLLSFWARNDRTDVLAGVKKVGEV